MTEKKQQFGESSPATDKWLLSSAMQKLIRRGRSTEAVGIAICLHQLDPNYLRRRLPVIAMEDIGIGGVSLCREVTMVCSSKKWWQENVVETITSLVSGLALSVKSRAACDAFCLTESHPDRSLVQPDFLKRNRDELIDIASRKERPQLERLIALRVLGGITLADGSYRRLSKFDQGALDEVARNLNLSDVARWLIASNAKTSGMSAMLPVVYDLADGAVIKKGRAFPHAMSMVGDIPLCALDMYTRVGKAALQRFYLASPALQDFIQQQAPQGRAIKLINMAMFQIESSLLDRYLSTPELDELKNVTEDAELLALGMTDVASRFAFYDLLCKSAGSLARTRFECLGLDPLKFLSY